MKNLIIMSLLIFPMLGISQAPQRINFQSVLRNTTGEVISNSSVSLRISILSDSITGPAVYVETHARTTDAGGLMSLQIGNGTLPSTDFTTIDWGGSAHFIKLEADFSGGNNYVLLGTQELMSVPYALYASKTDTSVLNLAARFSPLNNKLNIIDTSTMLSNYRTGLNNKVNKLDTVSMLQPYLRDADTTSMLLPYLRNADTTNMLANYRTGINAKLNILDTASMLQPYLRDVDTTSMLLPYLRDADTTAMLANYRTGINAKLNILDTASMLQPYLRDADTTSMLLPYLRNADTTAMLANYRTGINAKFNILDTASMLQPYLRDADTTSMLLPYLRNADTTAMLANYRTGINAKLNNADTSDMLNPYLRKADAVVSVETEPVFNASVAKGITEMDTAYWNRKTGNITGNIQYWNGTSWVNLAPGQNGQALILVNGIPSWSGAAYATLNTSSVSSITSTSVSGGGNISSDGGATVSARGLVYSTSTNPTLSNTVLTISSGTGSFLGALTGLSPITTYYIRAYATNSAGTAYGNETSFTTLPTVTDIDGNIYNTIQIGDQVWMSENLKTSRYRNGGSIPNVTDNTLWSNSTIGAWSYYNNNVSNNAIYGKLYNWYTTLGDTLCPTGWGVPTDAEWTTLTDSLGGESVAGRKMKSKGITYWSSQSSGTDNSSGFSSLPGGFRCSGSFDYIRNYAWFWSATEYAFSYAWSRYLYYLAGNVVRYNDIKKSVGASVRCLRD